MIVTTRAIDAPGIVFKVIGIDWHAHSTDVFQTITQRQARQCTQCILPARPELSMHIEGETAATLVVYRIAVRIAGPSVITILVISC
ncbi:MAG: hypothetical protein PVI50_02450 [Gammaproteobacteria bacterium]|jgi:hypothetical protein